MKMQAGCRRWSAMASMLALAAFLCVTAQSEPPVLAQEGFRGADEIKKALSRDLELGAPVDESGYSLPEVSPFVSLNSVHFNLNSAELTEQAKRQLDEVAAALTSLGMTRDLILATEVPAQKLLIMGHTCDLGGNDHNLQLSQRRAETVKEYLAKHGVAERVIETSGAGESRPVVPNTSELNRQKNRRVDFVRLVHAPGNSASPPTDDNTSSAETAPLAGDAAFLSVDFITKNGTGNEAKLKEVTTKKLKEGDRFALRLAALRGCHLYVLLRNASGEAAWLLPADPSTYGLYAYAGQTHRLPDPDQSEWYVLTAPAGTESVLIVGSSEPLAKPDLLPIVLKSEGPGLTGKKLRGLLDVASLEMHLINIEHVK